MPKTPRTPKPLSHDDIRAIRALRGKVSAAKLGVIYDRCFASIYAIQRRWTYYYVPDNPGDALISYDGKPSDRKFDVDAFFAHARRDRDQPH